MTSEFNKRHLANMLYSVPRIVDTTNLSVVSNDLMMAFLWYRSDTIESVSNFVNFEYGTIPNPEEIRHQIICGLKFVNFPVFIVDIVKLLANTVIPDSINQKWKNISKEEWREAVDITVRILELISISIPISVYRTQKLSVQQRATTYRLYAASQSVDDDNLKVFAPNIMAELPEVSSIEYGRVIDS